MSTVLIPGSFDPLHLGHVDVVERATELFDDVVVAVLHNPSKPSGTFTPEERTDLARRSLAGLAGVRVEAFGGLVVDAATEVDATAIVKGLRSPADFDVELQMAHTNRSVTGIQTVFIPCSPALSFVSSRFVREIAAQGGRVEHLVPAPVAAALADRFATSG